MNTENDMPIKGGKYKFFITGINDPVIGTIEDIKTAADSILLIVRTEKGMKINIFMDKISAWQKLQPAA